jgi:hypothetical protein
MSAYLLGVALGAFSAWLVRSILARISAQRIRANNVRLRRQQHGLVAEIGVLERENAELRDLWEWEQSLGVDS